MELEEGKRNVRKTLGRRENLTLVVKGDAHGEI